jgi:hypothetical protein
MENGDNLQASEALLAKLQDEIQKYQTPIDIQSLIHICLRQNIQGHLVILTQPHLGKIIAKDKTIESRFSKPRIAPFQRVQKGDVLFLKQSAGPLLAITFVSAVRFFGPLEDGEIENIFEEYRDGLALEQAFKESKRDSKYGTLIFLSSVTSIQPIAVAKTDRRAWIVLSNEPKQAALF